MLSACTPIVKNNTPNHQTIQINQNQVENSRPYQPIQINQVDNNNIVNTPVNYANMDKKHHRLLQEGEELIQKGERKKAILSYLNPIIKDYEAIYANNNKRIYTARTEAERDFYIMSANNQQQEARVLSETWSKAYYLKAYALLELKEINLAQKSLFKALALAPSNSKYLSEMGHIYHLSKDINRALKNYRLAEKAVKFFSPKGLKKQELLRAKKGVGFSLIELNRLDEAENMYKEVLKIDSRDKVARKELKYIQELKKRH